MLVDVVKVLVVVVVVGGPNLLSLQLLPEVLPVVLQVLLQLLTALLELVGQVLALLDGGLQNLLLRHELVVLLLQTQKQV